MRNFYVKATEIRLLLLCMLMSTCTKRLYPRRSKYFLEILKFSGSDVILVLQLLISYYEIIYLIYDSCPCIVKWYSRSIAATKWQAPQQQQNSVGLRQVIKQIAQQVSNANPGTNVAHIYLILIQLAKQKLKQLEKESSTRNSSDIFA